MDYEFKVAATVWRWEGPAGWYFVDIGDELSQLIRSRKEPTVAWGYIRIKARVGKSEWDTTLFPNKGAYIAAIKAQIRKKNL